MMTRSIGDWSKSSWVLPQPELAHFDVPIGTHTRVILASDGLWDVVSPERAAKLTREAESASEAAQKLLVEAKDIYLGERAGKTMGDDTTIMVIDLNPSLLAMQQLGGDGCCSVQ